MAEALFEDFLTCPVCLDPLKDPVTLGCHHSFCRSCLNSSWIKNPSKLCPVCRRRSSKEILEVNHALRELSLSFGEKRKVKELKFCRSHPETAPLFCLDEARAICPVCEFSLHTNHTVVSAEEAERRLKERAERQLKCLKGQKKIYEKLKQSYDQLQRHSEDQVDFCKRQIRAVFYKMQSYLNEEEEKALDVLREEQRRQSQALIPELYKVQNEIRSLSKNIEELQQFIDTETLIRAPTETLSKASSTYPLTRLKPKAGLLINQAKVLGNLGYRVWSGMQTLVTYSPVVLDPNTAESTMQLSLDLCGVRHGPAQPLPVVPERFTNEPIVLGSEGFSTGTHQWDVEVGDLPTWDIGVVKESVDKRGDLFAGAEYGVWCLWHGHGIYTDGSKQPIPVETPPEKIRVKVEYVKGEVSFYDISRIQTLLLRHKAEFREKLFPYVSVGPAPGASTREIRLSGEFPQRLRRRPACAT